MIRLRQSLYACRSCAAPALFVRCAVPVLLCVHVAGTTSLHASDGALPKAEVILDKFVEVTGGQTAYAKLHNRVSKGTIDFVGMGIKGATTIYAQAPDKQYTVIETDALGNIEEGTDGEVAWELMAMSGPRIKEGDERATALRMAVFDGTSRWRQLYKKVECVGVENVNERPCYKVAVTLPTGEPEVQYYDQESNLLLKTAMTLQHPMGALPVEAYPSDYRRVDGILIAHGSRQFVAGQEQMIKLESVEHNVAMSLDRFVLPEEVRVLVDRRKGADGTKQTGN